MHFETRFTVPSRRSALLPYVPLEEPNMRENSSRDTQKHISKRFYLRRNMIDAQTNHKLEVGDKEIRTG
jgi:hypothetical protein